MGETMKYNDFVLKKLEDYDESFSALAFPILGWLTAILAFGFFYPLWYFLYKQKLKKCNCKNCKNYKRND